MLCFFFPLYASHAVCWWQYYKCLPFSLFLLTSLSPQVFMLLSVSKGYVYMHIFWLISFCPLPSKSPSHPAKVCYFVLCIHAVFTAASSSTVELFHSIAIFTAMLHCHGAVCTKVTFTASHIVDSYLIWSQWPLVDNLYLIYISINIHIFGVHDLNFLLIGVCYQNVWRTHSNGKVALTRYSLG